MRIVATVVGGVKRKITSEREVTARTKVVTKPTRNDPPSTEGEARRYRRRDAAEDQGIAQRVAVRSAQDVLEVLGRELKIIREAQGERAHHEATVDEEDHAGKSEARDEARPADTGAHRRTRHRRCAAGDRDE